MRHVLVRLEIRHRVVLEFILHFLYMYADVGWQCQIIILDLSVNESQGCCVKAAIDSLPHLQSSITSSSQTTSAATCTIAPHTPEKAPHQLPSTCPNHSTIARYNSSFCSSLLTSFAFPFPN